jgi:outer membrane protein insertion porin family
MLFCLCAGTAQCAEGQNTPFLDPLYPSPAVPRETIPTPPLASPANAAPGPYGQPFRAQPPASRQSAQAPAARSAPARELIVDVRVVGNEAIEVRKILGFLRTRKDRYFDPEVVQADKRRLNGTGMFRDVRVFTQPAAGGVVVTFEVFERPTIQYVEYVGNRGLSDKTLTKETGLEVGDAINVYSIEEGRRKIEDLYHRKGYPQAQVTVTEGTSQGDRGVVFYISEGMLQRIARVRFIGNTIASDERLKTRIESKPGILWYLFRGKVDEDKIDEDVDKLTAYYRGLGFFRARVGRTLEYSDSGKWLTLTFVIDEGPRYAIRNVSVAGNERFGTGALLGQLKLASGDYFNLDKMNVDVNALRDTYGAQGYIFSDVRANPVFLEEPGQLDLVYKIDEGEQFRVGRINVHIAGEYPHTQEDVILDRLSIRPGDIVDIREVRASERRLKSSQLFIVNPAEGSPPRIVIRTPDLSDTEMIARGGRRGGVRMQSPETSRTPPGPRRVDLDVYVIPAPVHSAWGSGEPQDQQP